MLYTINGESFNDYLVSFRKLARNGDLCYVCLDESLLTKLRSGIQDVETREELLTKVPAPNLEEAINLCQSKEAAKQSNKELATRTAQGIFSSSGRHDSCPHTVSPNSSWKACYFCKRDKCDCASYKTKEKCSAFGKSCHKCGIQHHLGGSLACEKGFKRDQQRTR